MACGDQGPWSWGAVDANREYSVGGRLHVVGIKYFCETIVPPQAARREVVKTP